MKLLGKVCIVTGGGAGIGAAIAARCASEGAIVAIWESDHNAGQTVAADVGGSAHSCDVSLRADVQRACDETLAAHGRVDVLVNNAGIALAGPSECVTDDEWNRSIAVMQTGVFLCSQIVGRQLLAQRSGAIVNVSSINASEAFPMRLAYGAAKAAVVAMTEVLAIEWADRGVRVNSVAPGVTRTALVDRAVRDGIVDIERYERRTPMQRFAEPDEIARAVVFLASAEDASFITGETLRVDGGWSAQGWITEEKQ